MVVVSVIFVGAFVGSFVGSVVGVVGSLVGIGESVLVDESVVGQKVGESILSGCESVTSVAESSLDELSVGGLSSEDGSIRLSVGESVW